MNVKLSVNEKIVSYIMRTFLYFYLELLFFKLDIGNKIVYNFLIVIVLIIVKVSHQDDIMLSIIMLNYYQE